ncbi:MAG: murein hydrolase activator EnvC family protein [Solirubrobacteraceae bacterium]
MSSLSRPIPRVLGALAAALIAAVLIAGIPSAHAAGTGQLQQQIGAGQSRIQSLSGAVGAANARLAQLGASIASLEARLSRIQTTLSSDQAQLLRLQTQLTAARNRLAQLEAYQQKAEAVLSEQLVGSYESDHPDIVSVVLEARGFADLLERLSFASRIRKQSKTIVQQVRAARRATAAQATRLGALEVRQQALTQQILQQRNQLDSVRQGLLAQESAAGQKRSAAASQLANAKQQVASLQQQLSKIVAAQAAAAQAQSQSASSGSSSGAPASVGSSQVSSGGGFTFPMTKGAASPPGTWSLDQGVDISAPGNTPLLAVGSGTIVLHGIGGFGPSAPVLHLDSGQYVYYGHAGPGNMLPIGTHVSAGQVISEVGAGIVGISSGPHLEIGFCDASGTPLGGGTASQMMSLLQGSY